MAACTSGGRSDRRSNASRRGSNSVDPIGLRLMTYDRRDDRRPCFELFIIAVYTVAVTPTIFFRPKNPFPDQQEIKAAR